MIHPDWAARACLYQVNLRQYTKEGTITAFAAHLPRLHAMGVDILWLMPIHPIGERHRKGGLGSPYAVRDYTAVNPDLGTLADLKRLVDAAHGFGMHVILDWVANHTAWDHAWVSEHPDWYKKDERGEIHAYTFTGEHGAEYWTDVVGLDYADKAPLRDAMTEAMAFWLREADVDGFRCDVAGLVPTPFWNRVRAALDAIKPVFMLAEWSDPALHEHAFDATYDWPLYDTLTKIARGDGDARDLDRWLDERLRAGFRDDDWRMQFTSNHDKNAWVAHDGEAFGPALPVATVLTFTLPGMALIYGGQEARLDKRLSFFDKDAIDWRELPHAALYAQLLRLKHSHPALANGSAGGRFVRVSSGDDAVYAFRRARGEAVLAVTANLSAEARAGLPAWGWRIDT